MPGQRTESPGVPPGSTFEEVDGVKLAVSREGHGPPVVCLHAIGHGSGDFDAFVERVRQRHEVIRVDWPGHGQSSSDGQPVSAARYCVLLAALLDRLGVKQPIIVGNSIGGAAALLYASRHPVAGLVLCGSGGLVPVNAAVRVICRLFAAFFEAGERDARWFAPAFQLFYRHVVLPEPAATAQRERIIEAGRSVAPMLKQAWHSFARPDADLRALAAALDVPIWCAWSRSDRVVPLWTCRAAIRRFKRARVSLFTGGHSAFLEQPDAFADEFVKFAATTSARA